MDKVLKQLKEDLEMFGPDNLTITVSRKDLALLIKAYEKLKDESENKN